jgi:threonine aldolase
MMYCPSANFAIKGIKFHSDGARIFEASAGYGKGLDELA